MKILLFDGEENLLDAYNKIPIYILADRYEIFSMF